MFKLLAAAFFLLLPFTASALGYNPQSVGAGNPEIHIKQDATALVRSALVMQVVGNTYYVSVEWAQVPVRFTLRTNDATKVTKRYGGTAAVADLKLGDYVDIEGDFFVGSDFLGVTAKHIKDWSLQEESGSYSGTITEVSAEALTLKTSENPTMVVRMGASGTITKGAVALPFGRLQKGDKVLRAAGVYDYSRNILTANEIVVLQSQKEFLPRNYEGILKEKRGDTVPATLIVVVGSTEYAVHLAPLTFVAKKNRKPAELARFVAGDKVRFYGALRETEKTLQDAFVVDAEVVRNMNL